MIQDEPFVLGGKEFQSRLIIGTGKYPSMELMQQCHEASGADMVTVAIRRMELPGTSKTLLDYIDRDRFTILPNTAGCYDAESAILTAKLAREAGLSDFIKLEVIGDQKTLYPDTEELLKATQALVKEWFIVMPYTTDDVVVAKKLEDAGAAAVMPLGAPIGSGLGVCNPYTIRLIMEAVSIPVIVDAGVGTASDAAIAMEIGVDAVLMNTAIAGAQDPLAMAHAMRLAVEAGHFAYKAGRIPRKLYATASSPLEGIIGTT
jgi:thiazole synthase